MDISFFFPLRFMADGKLGVLPSILQAPGDHVGVPSHGSQRTWEISSTRFPGWCSCKLTGNLSCSLLHSVPGISNCLAHTRHSMNMCWIISHIRAPIYLMISIFKHYFDKLNPECKIHKNAYNTRLPNMSCFLYTMAGARSLFSSVICVFSLKTLRSSE